MTNEKYQKIFEINGAHQSGVTCANLGPRTGNVLATGGKDREVCLWAFSKNDPLLCLTGHHSAVESVIFSWNEHQVAGGSMSGTIKLWDLKEGQLMSTFTGHKGNITCLAHNQFDTNLWASGSLDSTAKLWDVRTKQPVNTCKGHSKSICTIDFSPDGRWLVTGADDCRIKVWDLVAGRPLAELSGHSGQVTAVQFHPNEYLLASGSSDKTVRFWDLETFECVSQSETDSQAVQCILFHPKGVCLYSVSAAALRVIGWEPAILYDTVPFTTGRAATPGGLLGVQKFAALAMIPSKQHVVSVGLPGPGSTFSVYSADVNQLKPFILDQDNATAVDQQRENNNFSKVQSPGRLRRSFHEKKSSPLTENNTQQLQQSSISEDDDSTSSSNSTSQQLTIYFETPQLETEQDYVAAFQAKPKLKRSPPGTPVPTDPTNERLKKPSDFGSTYTVTKAASPNPVRKVSTGNPTSSVESTSASDGAVGQKKLAVSGTAAKLTTKAKATVPPLSNSNLPAPRANKEGLSKKVVHEVTPLVRVKSDDQPSSTIDKTGLAQEGPFDSNRSGHRTFSLSPDDFLPDNFPFPTSLGRHSSSTPSMCVATEDDCLSTVDKGSTSMSAVLQHRVKSIAVVKSVWRTQGVRAAVETAINMRDLAVIVDLLNVLNFRSNLWHLDLCAMLLPQLKELLESKYDTYVHTAISCLRLVLRDFGQVIKNGLNCVPSIGVDITQEERFNKCQKCYIELVSIRSAVVNKQKLSSSVNAHTYREICLLMQLLDS